jgi:type II secretory pathway pseudopilin PulG
MTRLPATIAAVLALSGCATSGQQWTRENTIAEASWQAINALDGYQTAHIRDTPGVREVFPITAQVLGEQPDPGDTAMYFATTAITHALISWLLPPRARAWFQGGTIAVSGVTVMSNCSLGLPPCK